MLYNVCNACFVILGFRLAAFLSRHPIALNFQKPDQRQNTAVTGRNRRDLFDTCLHRVRPPYRILLEAYTFISLV